MADGATTTTTVAEGAFSQVLWRDGRWWHWRYLATMGAWVPVTGRDPEPRARTMDVDATRARVELAARGGVR